LTLIVVLPSAYGIGLLLHQQIGPPEVALFIVVAMLYVTLARGRLIGSSLMIHEAQYPRVFSIVKRTCAALDVPMPLIFVREDNLVPLVALGFGEPYALVISSHWIETFEDDELAFMVGRELGHIAAGHTRFLSILSVNGNENAFVSVIFGGWLRSCTMTCDRVGLLACGSVDAAMRAIAIASFHHFGRHINVQQFAEQGREIASDGTLRLGEWLGAEPYATRRISSMQEFITTPLYARNKAWFDREIPPEPPRHVPPADARVERRDCAGIWRRGFAFLIDFIVVSALIAALTNGHAGGPVVITSGSKHPTTHATPKAQAADSSDDDVVIAGPVKIDDSGVHVDMQQTAFGRTISGLSKWAGNLTAIGTTAYLTLLVGFAGQTFGMMITGLRVVRTDFRPAGLIRALVRYVLAVVFWPIILLCSPFTGRAMLHDRISGTRLIRAERQMARAASAVTNPA
jgi:uncharacterized RDD family membrane protein YckC